MIEAKFHLLQVEQKVASPHPIIASEFCFGKRPETLDAVDMVPLSRKLTLSMVDPVVSVAIREEAVVASKRVRVDRAALGHLLLDDEPQNGTGYVGYGAGIDPAVALEKAENSDFSSRAPAPIALAVSTEVRLIDFNLAGKRRLAFAFSGNRGSDAPVDAFCAVAVDAQLAAGAEGGAEFLAGGGLLNYSV